MYPGVPGVSAPAFKGNLGDNIEKQTNGVGITWTDRPRPSSFQWFCLFVYIGIMGAFFVQGFMAVSQQNMRIMHPKEKCPDGWWHRESIRNDENLDHWCLSPELKGPWDECQSQLAPVTTAIGREEAAVEKAEQVEEELQTETLWSILGSNMAVTGTIFPLIILSSIGWFFALKHFPFAVVYGTIGTAVVSLVALGVHGIYYTSDFRSGIGQFICAGICVIFTLAMRKQISFVCRATAAACKILKMRLSIFGAALALKLLWVPMIILALWFMVASAQIVEVQEVKLGSFHEELVTVCDLPKRGRSYQAFFVFGIIAISMFFDMALVLVSAVGVGGYYFHRDDPSAPPYPALTALSWVFTSSSGAVAESSVIMVLLNCAKQYLEYNHCKAWFCIWNPMMWILKFVWMCFGQILQTMSRFLLIMHGFHGGDFNSDDPRRPTKEVLIKHLGTAFTNGVVGAEVLSFSGSLLATTLGLATHVWLDAAEGVHMFTIYPSSFVVVPLIFLVLTDMYYTWGLPILMILTMFEGSPELRLFFIKPVSLVNAALFVSFVAKIVLQFFVDVVFHATDGLLYCFVLDQESGKQIAQDMGEIYSLIQEAKADSKKQDEEKQQLQAPAAAGDYGAMQNNIQV